MRLSNPHLSFAAGFGTLNKQVAGFHRAVPSTALDKAVCNFLIYCIHFFLKVNTFFDFLFKKMFTILLWTFAPKTGMIYIPSSQE